MSQQTSAPATSPALQSDIRQRHNAGFPLEDRLKCGWFSIEEACDLKGCSRSTFYADARAGLVSYKKHGRRSRVHGPELAKYLAGAGG